MIKRKIPIAFVLTSLIVLILSRGFTSLNEFIMGWLFVFPFLFLYALPVSILAEVLTKASKSPFKRTMYSFFIHLGFSCIFYFGDNGFATVATITALAFFVLDTGIKLIGNKNWFQRTFFIVSPILLFLSFVFWIIAIFQAANTPL